MKLPPVRTGEGKCHFLIALAALFVVHPLIVHGCSDGHDFDFHLVNWMDAASQLSHGNLHPHWTFSAAYNSGEPRFVFYPPLSWMLGALLGLLLTHLPGVSLAAGWNATPMVFTWIVLTLSGITMFRLARGFADANAALLAAMLYLANPYMLFTAYERTAYGELLAAAWMPLLLLTILSDTISISWVAVPVALLWLTNAPAAVMGCYALALLAVVRIVIEMASSQRRKAIDIAVKTTAGAALGLGVAAFYIVPAAYERRYVQVAMATIAGMQIDSNFLFEHTGTSSDALMHDEVLRRASWIAIVLLAAILTALIAALLRTRKPSQNLDVPLQPSRRHGMPLILPLAVLSAGIALMLTPLSAPIWSHAPQASFLQFPWRLLALLAPAVALAFAIALGKGPQKFNTTAALGMALVAALTLPAYHLFRQTQYPEDMPAGMLAAFQAHTGFEPTDEYTLKGADNDSLSPNAPMYWLAQSAVADAPAGQHGSAPQHLALSTPESAVLILNLRNYPAWQVWLNGALDAERQQRSDGLIALTVPAGQSTIELRYIRMPDAIFGDLITMLAILTLAWLLVMQRGQSSP